MSSQCLDISTEVSKALARGQPVVALESTILSHGMPWPENVETAHAVEKIIRDAGAVPATTAILKGAPESRPFRCKKLTISEATVRRCIKPVDGIYPG